MDKLPQNGKRETIERKRLIISGTVQGVGFRPFVYRLAKRYNLCGFIANRSSDVIIDIESKNGGSEKFLLALNEELPAVAHISSLNIESLQPLGYTDFIIRKSAMTEAFVPNIPPDITLCEDCLRELFTSSDRRYLYPFINCTNCGPRFTITARLPYDRCNTSMNSFQMCPHCQREYDDPLSRRFHAQPNACPLCGPKLELADNRGNRVDLDHSLTIIADLLKEGKILAIRALGGFQLVVDAKNQQAVERLRMKKHRWKKPFAVMLRDMNTILKFCVLSEDEQNYLESKARPILIVKMKQSEFLADAVSPQDVFCGVMLPYTPLHHLLLRHLDALVMTSGNLTDEPIVIDNQQAFERLGTIADYILLHDRDILSRCDDSVVRLIDRDPVYIRRARGYVPQAVPLTAKLPAVLAVGADLKNTVCMIQGNKAYPSQHIGDLDAVSSQVFFRETIHQTKQMLKTEPLVIAHDMHPGYFSSRWAQKQPKSFGVQHHHAHIASCLAENQTDERVIGFAFDGTGFGTDGAIWGGEVLLADCSCFQRIAHLDYIPLPGGDSGVKEPWRMAVSHFAAQGNGPVNEKMLAHILGMNETKINAVWRMVQSEFNCIPTSSMGRLFDAVAALLNICKFNNYEGEAAIELEKSMYRSFPNIIESDKPVSSLSLPFCIDDAGWDYRVRTRDVMNSIVEHLLNKQPVAEIALGFHHSLVKIFTQLAEIVRGKYHINKVVLSGGCFQNYYLNKMFNQMLRQHGFTVLNHRIVPPNDGGISLGQAVVAAMNLDK